jgi:hypothetical protein
MIKIHGLFNLLPASGKIFLKNTSKYYGAPLFVSVPSQRNFFLADFCLSLSLSRKLFTANLLKLHPQIIATTHSG